MICVTLLKFEDGTPKGFVVKGHSGSARRGHDIVCAAVSSASYLVVNTLVEVVGVKAEAEVRDGYMKFIIDDAFKESSADLLRGFALHITELKGQYPAYVNITEV